MQGKELRITALLCLDTVFFFLEVIIGYMVHSLALVADSFHMLNDIFSLIIALWAVRVAKSKKETAEYTYGWQRAEILGALINAVFLLALCFSIFVEAIQRFFEPQEIKNPVLILVVGCAGLASNFVGLLLFHEHGHSHSHDDGHSHEHSEGDEEQGNVDGERTRLLSKDKSKKGFYVSGESGESGSTVTLPEDIVRSHVRRASLVDETHNHSHSHEEGQSAAKPKSQSLNMKGVFLHVMGDALGNVGVIATALFIWKTDYSWRFFFDPVVSLVITAIIFSSALPLCKQASKILLQGTPQSVNVDEVRAKIEALDGVASVHDLHIWILKEDLFIATLHIAVTTSPDNFMDTAKNIRILLHEYGVHSATIQPEFLNSTTGSVHDLAANGSPSGAAGTSGLVGGSKYCFIDCAVGCHEETCNKH